MAHFLSWTIFTNIRREQESQGHEAVLGRQKREKVQGSRTRKRRFCSAGQMSKTREAFSVLDDPFRLARLGYWRNSC
ncbi:hypothetical protein X777_14998 [Ooceraea biroi]|uniref:Uncharacterized protein n=1 Tax=Ooceraea biroi TaxID=2015173 RepID=A0A026WUP3_OOCBI|nr:hypothetical protein X777_14998 [Ooceraea biroi]